MLRLFSKINFREHIRLPTMSTEGVHGKRTLVTLDVMSNSPFSHRQKQGNLEGESGS